MTDLGKVEPSLYSDSKEYLFLSCHLLDVYWYVYQIYDSEHFSCVIDPGL